MSVTITIKDGRKVRYQGRHRYIVVSTYGDKLRILKRSDNLQTADRFAMSQNHTVVLDTVTKEEV